MLIRKAYKFRLKTSAQQAEQLSRFAGCSRLVWNKALALQKKRFEEKAGVLGYARTCLLLVAWKEEHVFLRDLHSQPLQQTLKDLSRTMRECFKNSKGFPRFKKKGQHDSFRFPQGFKIDDSKVYLPKVGWIGFHKSREIEGKVKNVTISKTAGKWHVAMQVEMLIPEPVHSSRTMVGIDMGIARFATLSDGTALEPVNSFRKWEGELGREQRGLSRKSKFSQNWNKQKGRIQKIHTKIARVRNDFLQKASTKISKNHAIIVLESLKVANMSASAKGTLQTPGRNVRAKAGRNKSILDQGWYEFRRQLTYKQKWHGGQVILINPVNSSRTCSRCNHVAAENRASQSQFQCVECGFCENADVNAAQNILAAGHAVVACGDIIRQVAV